MLLDWREKRDVVDEDGKVAWIRYQGQYQDLVGLSKDSCLYLRAMKKTLNVRIQYP